MEGNTRGGSAAAAHSAEKTMFDERDTEKFIQAVEDRPSIWNMKSEEYGNREIKRKAWEDVTVMFLPETASLEEKKEKGKMLQSKWKNIRDRYAREMKSFKCTKSGSGGKKKAPYIYSRQLAFLNDIFELKTTSNSLDLSNSLDHEDDDEVSEPVIPIGNLLTSSSAEVEEPRSEKTTSSTSKQYGKKRKLDPVDAKIVQILERSVAAKESKSVVENDEDHHFVLSLIPTLKNVPTHLKLQTRMEIIQVLMKNTAPLDTIRPNIPPQSQWPAPQYQPTPPMHQPIQQYPHSIHQQPLLQLNIPPNQPYYRPPRPRPDPTPTPSPIESDMSESTLLAEDNTEFNLFGENY